MLLDILIHEQAEIWYWYQWMQTTVWGDAATRDRVYTGATQFTLAVPKMEKETAKKLLVVSCQGAAQLVEDAIAALAAK